MCVTLEHCIGILSLKGLSVNDVRNCNYYCGMLGGGGRSVET